MTEEVYSREESKYLKVGIYVAAVILVFTAWYVSNKESLSHKGDGSYYTVDARFNRTDGLLDGIQIPDDSSASIVSSSLMGSKYIEIEPGGSEDMIPQGGEFSYTQDAMILEELLDRIVSIGKANQKKGCADCTSQDKK